MNKLIPLCLCLSFHHLLPAQSNDSVQNAENSIFLVVEKMPVFKCGKVDDFVAANTKYPSSVIDKNIEGRVIMTFTINNTGHLSDFEIIKGLGKEFDNEAMRVAQLTDGCWTPGYRDNIAVKVRYVLKIKFDGRRKY